MAKTDVKAILTISMIAGLAGGLLVAMVAAGPPLQAPEAAAQESGAPAAPAPAAPKVLSAGEFRLLDSLGRTRAVLGLSPKGQPVLQMRDENDITVVWLGISEDSGLVVRDRDGKTRLVLSLDTMGEPSITMRDRNQKMKSVKP